MRVDSKSCSKPPCNPCNLSWVLLARAIFSASMSVAMPELSKWVMPDRSTHTSSGHGDCNRARSRVRIAGEESISIGPDKYARVLSLLATMLICTLPMLSRLSLTSEPVLLRHEPPTLFARRPFCQQKNEVQLDNQPSRHSFAWKRFIRKVQSFEPDGGCMTSREAVTTYGQ